MDPFIRDLRFALRQHARRPGFTAVLVGTLALGIGATTAVFSVVDGVLLRPLPYPDSDEIVAVWSQFPSMGLMEFPSSEPEYLEFREAAESFEAVGGWVTGAQTITGGDAPERVEAAAVTASFWDVFAVPAERGRTFTAEEDLPGSDDVAVVSHGLWERRFGGDPGAVGSSIRLDGETVTLVGVLPAEFAFPDPDVDVWRPVAVDPTDPGGRASHYLSLVGRLRDGVSVERAGAELETLVARWSSDALDHHEWNDEFHPAILRPLQAQIVGDVDTALWILLGAVALVLLIACANVANLLLVRGEGRQRELSIRYALGADRGRVLRQLGAEALLLAVTGGVLGTLLAWTGVRTLPVLAPDSLPRIGEVGLDLRVLSFAAAATLLSALLFGLAPGLRASITDVRAALGDESRGSTVGRGGRRLRGALVVSETALAVTLLVAAGLLVQSFWRLNQVDPGFDAEGVLALRTALPEADYPDAGDVTGFYRDLLPRLAALPGVEAAGAVRVPPLGGDLPPNDIEIENFEPPEEIVMNLDIQVVTRGYFRTMGIGLVRGRLFQEGDEALDEPVAVVNETAARRYFSDRGALGERIRQPGGERPWARIVGVVEDVRHLGLGEEPRGELYFLHAHSPRVWYPVRAMTLVLGAGAGAEALIDAVRREVAGLDPSLALYRVETMERAVARSTASERFAMLLQLVFGLLALLLAAVGIYGVLAHSVAQRTREIGIRMALGAGREQIVGLVVRQGMALSLAATALGLLGAVAAGRIMAGLLFGVGPRDPATLAVVVGTILGVSLLATWLPARRASSVDPGTALRYD